ncbi:hypothetical protein M5K25_023204 [Dendrobium thyrsiflorum]|uniref:Uncharacterized protein n=1 Tax=Dendrobium thyrsiflorum TaxID=117978 RepID=A0ABD0UEW1_DENTH
MRCPSPRDFKPRARTHPAAGGNHNSLHRDLTKVLPKEQKCRTKFLLKFHHIITIITWHDLGHRSSSPPRIGMDGWMSTSFSRGGKELDSVEFASRIKRKARTASLGLFRRLTGDTMPFTKGLQATSQDPSCGWWKP